MEYLATKMDQEVSEWCRIYQLEHIRVHNNKNLWTTSAWWLTNAASYLKRRRRGMSSTTLFTPSITRSLSKKLLSMLEKSWAYYAVNFSMDLMGLGNKNIMQSARDLTSTTSTMNRSTSSYHTTTTQKHHSGCSSYPAMDSTCNSWGKLDTRNPSANHTKANLHSLDHRSTSKDPNYWWTNKSMSLEPPT